MTDTRKRKNGPSDRSLERSSSRYRLRPAPLHAAQLTPKLSDADRADIAEGVELYNAGRYWHSHEAWERVWQRHDEPWRYFIQGLIQAAAAQHQLQRGIRHGTIKHLKNALVKLEVAPADFAGLNLQEFRDHLRGLLSMAEGSTEEEVRQLKNLSAKPIQRTPEPRE